MDGVGLLDALGLRGAIEGGATKGLIDAHHVYPKFMGGRPEQETYNLIRSFHQLFHSRLRPAMKGPGVPPIGGVTGSKDAWASFFDNNPGMREKAIEILRQISRDFDIERGTSMLPALEKELGIVQPRAAPPAPPAASMTPARPTGPPSQQ